MVFAFPLVLVAFSGIDASSGLAGQVAIGRAGLRRLIGVRLVAAMVPYLGIALVASAVLPPTGGKCVEAPLLGVAEAFDQAWLREPAKYLVAISALVILITAAQAAMLGLSRLGYALAVNRQIPSKVGSLSRTRATPVGIIGFGAVIGDLPADPRRPRVPGRDLRVRGDDRVRDRRRVGRVAALQGARPRPAVPDAAQRPVPRRLAADPGRAVRRDVGDRVPVAADRARERALGRRHLDGRRRLALRRLPHVAGQAGPQARDRAGGRADAARRRGRVRLDARPDPRHAAGRRHHADRRAARLRGERTTTARAAR